MKLRVMQFSSPSFYLGSNILSTLSFNISLSAVVGQVSPAYTNTAELYSDLYALK
jgi:hypothetical protein